MASPTTTLERGKSYLATRPFEGADDFESFRAQEMILIALNSVTMCILAVTYFGFESFMVSLRPVVPYLFVARLVEQAAEGLWLSRLQSPLSPAAVRIYAHFSIWANLAIAALASILAHSDEAHFMVLLFIPLIAACFRYSMPGAILVACLASSMTYLDQLFYYGHTEENHLAHVFEIATTMPMYPIVAVILWLLVQRMRQDTSMLRDTLGELEHTHNRLVQEEKMAAMGRMATSVAHEIRNPVAIITSALAMSQRASCTTTAKNEFSEIAAKEAKRLEHITNNFLNFARSPPLRIRIEPLSAALEYVADVLRPRLEEKGVRIEIDCPEALFAPMDMALIQQALMNLVLNAIAFTGAGAAIVLRARRDQGYASMDVENPGDAIAEANEAAIFEPFFSDRPEGTGLGLAIGTNIAQAHGGDLRLTKNLPGCVCFTLRLPLSEMTSPKEPYGTHPHS